MLQTYLQSINCVMIIVYFTAISKTIELFSHLLQFLSDIIAIVVIYIIVPTRTNVQNMLENNGHYDCI